MPWIESHTDLESHPKLMSLMMSLGWDLNTTIGILHRFWWWCLKYAEDGDLRKFNDSQLAGAVALNGDEAKRFVDGMVEAGFLDRTPYFRVHGWLDRVERYLVSKYHTSNPMKINQIMRKNRGERVGSPKGQPKGHLKASHLTVPVPYQTRPVPDQKIKTPPLIPPGGGPPDKPPAVPGHGSPTTNGQGPPRPETNVQRVVRGFKIALNVAEDDKAWDRVYFRRYAKAASDLLILFEQDVGRVADCIEAVSRAMERKSLSWTPETIVKHAGDWKNGRLMK